MLKHELTQKAKQGPNSMQSNKLKMNTNDPSVPGQSDVLCLLWGQVENEEDFLESRRASRHCNAK